MKPISAPFETLARYAPASGWRSQSQGMPSIIVTTGAVGKGCTFKPTPA